jgi:hemerythrin
MAESILVREDPGGDASLEGEHHLQLELLTALRTAIMGGADRSLQSEILDRFVDYTKVHFASEQLLMRLYDYGHYQAHLQEHEAALERLSGLDRELGAVSGDEAIRTIEGIAGRIIDHISRADRMLHQHLQSVGAAGR